MSNPPPAPQCPWDVVRHGELQSAPHKVWTHDLVPTHTHEGFHQLSWRPLKHERLDWHKWLLDYSPELASPTMPHSGIQARPSKQACPHCLRHHNQSMHGVLASYDPSQPLAHAWLHSWPCPRTVARWCLTGVHRDPRIVAHPAIPRSPYVHLKGSMGGLQAACQAVGVYHPHPGGRLLSTLLLGLPPNHCSIDPAPILSAGSSRSIKVDPASHRSKHQLHKVSGNSTTKALYIAQEPILRAGTCRCGCLPFFCCLGGHL